ncbi:hypothetical protein Moror_15019 [Moniliophthora roreri MCA 2997]|uniref:UbiA prenyltransferase n=1 Tax=Moniliophthora roreri (strain MCA 2997) TaxID=1381753 RepID=V2WSH2_MONRO|nr:hypothetical protein Moror_15019 [Moniliophthora roreri MCA 2997]
MFSHVESIRISGVWLPLSFFSDLASIFLQECIAFIVGMAQIIHAFSKSDYKTILVPVTCYGLLASSRLPDFVTTINLLVWIWTFLLQFCAANQIYSIDEDLANKPYRPIPSGLISVQFTYVVRWGLVPVCLYLSWVHQVFYAGLSLTLAFIFYNELGLDSYWYSKSLLNAIGIVSWNVGAALITSQGPHGLCGQYQVTPFISVALIWTTIHVQDFRDEAGDRLQGRITLPTFLPVASRYLTLFLLNSWSVALAIFWQLGPAALACFVAFGIYLSFHILLQRTEEDDKVSLRLYMIWLTLAQTLPFLVDRLQGV